ncbi:Repeat domain-containing protein [Muriicola jejuensis]|uniref:CRTAC1 family protein n=1 Tax=Muriicola jejuensis TaxID=504488 RepID=A0A6P0UAU4_9FLAO|nr:VCBS repeat-containing protein [Muriicola jejuensis]NER10335.1 CRTAC1 family protein [Muriicola jejuensis]SMP01232.1 Repeat domain-containing protein [Muriicola jejuensis]
MRTKNVGRLLILGMTLWLAACTSESGKKEAAEEAAPTLFSLLPSSRTGIDFVNVVENQKNFNIFKYRNFYNGGGVAIGDINNDGLPDIYLTGNMVSNKLYLNKGGLKFQDISASAGVEGSKPWSTGVVMVDINQDGLLDIYVSNAGNMEGNNHDNDLYINNGDLTFTERAAEYNLAKTGFSTHASFFDYDKDGDLDAYILNNSNIPVSSLGYAAQREVRAQDWEGVPDIFRGVGDMLLRNDDGKFVDVSEQAGIYGSLIGFGLGIMITDINKDLYPDIYVSNDFYERDYLYINNRDGTFTEDIKGWTSHLSLSAMGIDMADINNDGHAEIFITDMLPEADERVKSVMEFDGYDVFRLKQEKDFYQQYIQNTLQLNNGNGSFSEIAYFSGVDATDWSWAGLMFDMDNDGFRDIFVTNGINHDLTDLDFVDFFANEIIQKMALTGRKESIDSIINKMPIRPQPNYAYRNNRDLTFSNANKDWGFELPTMSNGAGYGDLDNDGDLDLVVSNVNMEAFLYENHTDSMTENHFIKLKFQGPEKNKFAIGTTVNLYLGNTVIFQELIPSRGFQSSMDYIMTIGLGKTSKIDSLRVIWPDDRTQKLADIASDQTLLLSYDQSEGTYMPPKPERIIPLLQEVPNNTLAAHQENNYNDFDYEGLIYKLLSEEGPALAIGDVDGDGNEDIFLGGASGQPGTLYKHLGNGKVRPLSESTFLEDLGYEDTSASFFDADGDGDLDLMVGSGGNQVGEELSYRNRLYVNDGKGKFSRSEVPLPSAYKNTSTIAPYDFDGDGDVDVFIGSRSVVGTYGVDPDHLFLENNGDGTFRDATERLAYDLRDAGMITDATWADMDGDGRKDLVTVSEWGTPKIFRNSGRRLSKMSTDLDRMDGWWNVVEVADLDNDGDNDLILGNQGANLHYKPEADKPMKIWVNDFDGNGTIEQIVTMQENGRDYPLHQKKELTNQIVSLKKQNLKASEYARRSIDELWPPGVIQTSIMKKSSISESVIAINEGGGKFTTKVLPTRVQLSCVCGISCTDINNDGYLDLIMGGNNFEFKPQYSRLDASYGNVLLGNKDLDFHWEDYTRSGFFIRDEVKHLGQFKDRNGSLFLIAAINDSQPKIYKINE